MIRPSSHPRGTVLIVALWVTIALTGLVLTLAFSMRTEAMAAANRVSYAQAGSAERGVEQWLLSVVDQELATPGTIRNTSMEACPVGRCTTWVLRPDHDNSAAQAYGMADEAGKVDLNTADREMLMKLPGMTEDIADAIIDWRDGDSTVSSQGAEDDYYMSLPEPYHCKNGPFESVDELLLVKGVTPELLYGYDHNQNGIIEDRESQSGNTGTVFNAAGDTGAGIFPFITVYGIQATTGPTTPSSSSGSSGTATTINVNSATSDGQLRTLLTNSLSASRAQEIVLATQDARRTRQFENVFDYYFRIRDRMSVDDFTKIYTQIAATRVAPAGGPTTAPATPAPRIAKININTAPREVLLCLPQLTDSDVDAIVTQRQSSLSSDDPSNIAWLAGIIDGAKALAMGHLVTGQSVVYSGDIVAISPDGRAFRRARVIVSAQTGSARIVYRRDLTPAGWPLPTEIRQAIRSGQGYEAPLSGGISQ